MSPDQCREARELLRWTRQELAGTAGVAPWAVNAFEEGREVLTGYKAAFRTALEAVGIGFPFEIAECRARQVGVTYSPPDRSEGH